MIWLQRGNNNIILLRKLKAISMLLLLNTYLQGYNFSWSVVVFFLLIFFCSRAIHIARKEVVPEGEN